MNDDDDRERIRQEKLAKDAERKRRQRSTTITYVCHWPMWKWKKSRH
jgi:hypothetical protein